MSFSLQRSAGPALGPLVLAGLAALLTGIGLGRFAYAALVPGMIGEGHVDVAGAGYLAAANVGGYLIGAAGGGRIGRRFGTVHALRGSMIGTVLALLACAVPFSLAWLIVARLVAGITGGFLMVLAAPAVLARIPAERRGSAGGILFTGIGLGITFSGVVVPLLADLGTGPAWAVLALLGAGLTVLTWNAWPGQPVEAAASGAPAAAPQARPRLMLLGVAYASDAIGFVPHTVYWVDFVARDLGYGIGMGGIQWSLFGLGAAAGPAVMGMVAQRIGFGRAFVLALGIKAAAVILPVLSPSVPALVVSSILVGALTPASASLAAGRITELLQTDRRQQAWAQMTMLFALVQALGAVVMAELAAATHQMALLFLLGGSLLALGAGAAEIHRRLLDR
ncbi:YbfB/YjiJ family MFS transporter [Geminicoccus roseus]|uniref:YbfB/YjiJ family MFS transporter n=1 Tax=Geminicoccus roseus TaxID=404900 RepID=UPI00041043F1|nr:YbfB/YjiJ family MFS transporter [Geminicoccus roseus]